MKLKLLQTLKTIVRRTKDFFVEKPGLILEIAGHCNKRCRYCYRLPESQGSIRFMQLSTLEIVLKQFAEYFRSFNITLSGGEPALHPDLPLIVEKCAQYDPNLVLISNLELCTPNLLKKLQISGLKNIQTTFISPIPAEHDALCGANSFSNWLLGLNAIKKTEIQVTAILLVTRSNLHSLSISLEFLIALGFKTFLVNRFNAGYQDIKNNLNLSELFLRKSDLINFLNTLEKFGQKHKLSFTLGIPIPSCLINFSEFPHVNFGFCPLGQQRITYWGVTPEGCLKPCNHFPIILGDLTKNTLEQILDQETWHNFYDSILTPPSFCQKCSEFIKCKGGCRGAAFTWTKNIENIDPWVERVLLESANQ